MPKQSGKPKFDYRSSGVDVDAGDDLVQWLQDSDQQQPHSDKIIGGIGGFAALFKFKFPEMKSPILVSSTDGVGTKVKLASDHSRMDGVGQDLVAMCVNDLVTCGAQPLFFLDYYASGKLNLDQAKGFLKGVRSACRDSDLALIGGETAEMPGLYSGRDFDCAGFAVGVVDEPSMLGAHKVKLGDTVIGVSSSGFHSNGYSLLRKVFAEDLIAWVDRLLIPTHLYVKLVQATQGLAHAYAHITGGGIDNLPRVIQKNFSIELKRWEFPEIFKEVQSRARLSDQEMLRTLNCGVGYAIYCSEKDSQFMIEAAEAKGFNAFEIGRVVDEPAKDQLIWGNWV